MDRVHLGAVRDSAGDSAHERWGRSRPERSIQQIRAGVDHREIGVLQMVDEMQRSELAVPSIRFQFKIADVIAHMQRRTDGTHNGIHDRRSKHGGPCAMAYGVRSQQGHSECQNQRAFM